jgi:hypothetical protein
MTPTDFFNAPPEQGTVGSSPQRYLDELGEAHRPDPAQRKRIPHGGTKPLSREQLRDLCRDKNLPPLTAYACIMAWGGRDFGNYRRSLEDGGERISRLICNLRSSTATRLEDFKTTQKAARSIPGLGISFYTKLLFFMREEPDAYILDQWTAKSALVLFPETRVRLTVIGLPDPDTTGLTYEAFCSRLEACCGPDGWGAAWRTGEEVERTLFDSPNGPWREWLKSHWEAHERPRRAAPRTRSAGSNDDGSESNLRALAEAIKSRYVHMTEQGLVVPDGCGGFAKPNRLHVCARRTIQFQFILNRGDVRAQIFFQQVGVPLYDRLVEKLHPVDDGRRHDFGQGITGNGPMQGITRQISLSSQVSGGYASPAAEWPAIAESAVEAMATLFQFLEPHLTQ